MLTFRNRHFFLLDLVLLPAAAVVAFVLRLDAEQLSLHYSHMLAFALLALPVKLVVFWQMGLYSRFWRYASTDELVLIATAAGVGALLTAGLLFAVVLPLTGITGFPRSIPFIDGLLTLMAVGGPRFGLRVAQQGLQRERRRQLFGSDGAAAQKVLVIGAGDAGAMIVREMQANPQTGLVAVGLIDDDWRKAGMRIHGVPVLGGREQIPELSRLHRIDQVIIAMPTVPGSTIREIVGICLEAGVPARTVPGLNEIIAGQVRVSQIRDVAIEDLLRREPVRIDRTAVDEMLRSRRVLVTGGGGSIGSELCRQIAQSGPEQLVTLGHGENSIFEIRLDLLQRVGGGQVQVTPVIADIRDRRRLEAVFAEYKPELVFHAAAHKHVPLMEMNPCEAVVNNVLGTRNVIDLSLTYGVGRFVLVSTDKAVNPTSVMGTTKRIAELLVGRATQRRGGAFVAVRFGNVLGSRGSVVNIFRRQIARGGPVAVTDAQMRRYFMTVQEAVQLVLQAAALGSGGEVFVLDMGEPVRIIDLAADLIRLSGLRPKLPGQEGAGDWDVEVVFTGARPGEKLSEELFVEGETPGPTRHEKILAAIDGGAGRVSGVQFDAQVDSLIELAQSGDEAGVLRMLAEIVPEYRPPAG